MERALPFAANEVQEFGGEQSRDSRKAYRIRTKILYWSMLHTIQSMDLAISHTLKIPFR